MPDLMVPITLGSLAPLMVKTGFKKTIWRPFFGLNITVNYFIEALIGSVRTHPRSNLRVPLESAWQDATSQQVWSGSNYRCQCHLVVNVGIKFHLRIIFWYLISQQPGKLERILRCQKKHLGKPNSTVCITLGSLVPLVVKTGIKIMSSLLFGYFYICTPINK